MALEESQRGLDVFVETSYHGVSEGVCVSDVETFPETSPYDGGCSVLPSPHWRRAGDEVREGQRSRSQEIM